MKIDFDKFTANVRHVGQPFWLIRITSENVSEVVASGPTEAYLDGWLSCYLAHDLQPSRDDRFKISTAADVNNAAEFFAEGKRLALEEKKKAAMTALPAGGTEAANTNS